MPNMGHGTDVGVGMEKAWIPPLLLLMLSNPAVTTAQRPAPSWPTAAAFTWLSGGEAVKRRPVSVNAPFRT